jgi:hypothetical protein
MLGRTTSERNLNSLERNLNSLFIMNSAGEEDEEQVDYGGDSGEENSMSFATHVHLALRIQLDRMA